MTAHYPKELPEFAQVDRDAIPFENYRSLAGAVVARAVEDFVIVHIFYRDDAVGRFDYIYRKTAEHYYKKHQNVLERHADKKRELRKVIRENTARIQELEPLTFDLKKKRMFEEGEIQIIEDKLKAWDHPQRNKTVMREAVRQLNKDRIEHEKELHKVNVQLNDLLSEITQLRKEVQRAKGILKNYAETESIDKREFRASYHHRTTCERAENDERYVLRWFSSPLFEIISPMSGEAIVYNTRRAVHERGINRANKYIYFLPSKSERGEGDNPYDREKRKKQKKAKA